MPVFLTSWFPPCAPGTCAAVPITWPEFAKKPSRSFFIPDILLQFVRIFCDWRNRFNKEAQATTTTASKGMSKEAKQAALARAKQWADDQRNRFNKEAQATTKKHSNKWAEDDDDDNDDNTYPFYTFLQRLDKKGAELNSSMEQVTARFGGISP